MKVLLVKARSFMQWVFSVSFVLIGLCVLVSSAQAQSKNNEAIYSTGLSSTEKKNGGQGGPLSAEQIEVSNRLERTHLVAPGDAISLLVYGEPDLSVENLRVPQNGRVSFPLIGSVTVAGKTTDQVTTEVTTLLSQGYVRNPRVSVSMYSYRPVFVQGEVRSAGAFAYSEALTVAKAIALAGGPSDYAELNGVSILREGETYVDNLSIDSQTKVESGDVIIVTERTGVKEAATSFIYLHGEVTNPGEYVYRSELTVEKAIALAGGFTLRASKRKISISRYEGADEDGKPTRMKRVKLHTAIRPGDVIQVGASWF